MDREQLYEGFDNGVIGLDDIIDISQKDGYNQALKDFANALIDGEQNEEFVYNIEKIVEKLRK